MEIVRSEGLAHLSYLIGDKGKAAVIDPRFDCEIYEDTAYRHNLRISHIFETHCNEDYVTGSTRLAKRTGAKIYHGRNAPFTYGNAVSEGDTFELGNILIRILETPGHTPESISIVFSDTCFSKEPVAVFSGDTMFVGDVGRTDLFSNQTGNSAGLLYDTLHKRLLPLGDHVILYPAHGGGSLCGTSIASREFSTLGYERKYNPVFQMSRNEFITYKMNEHHYKPPYFDVMQRYNLEGAPSLKNISWPAPIHVDEFAKAISNGMTVLDVRGLEAFANAYIPGSIAIPLEIIPLFAGWFLSYDSPIGLVIDQYDQAEIAARYLIRLGYDNIVGYLEHGMYEWEASGRKCDRIPAVYTGEILRRLHTKNTFTLLDVRCKEEYEKGHLPNAINIYVGELPKYLDKIPTGKPITCFCTTGRRAIIAASILKRNGFQDVEDWLGSITACSALGCPVITGPERLK